MPKNRNRPITAGDVTAIARAAELLREARESLRGAGAHHAADYVARAGKSTQGALNHAKARTERMQDLKPPTAFEYSPWRHGGWYVHNVRYPSGSIGCVSRNYPDRKWRIACDPRPFSEQPTFRNRDEAARAEWEGVRDGSLIRAQEQRT